MTLFNTNSIIYYIWEKVSHLITVTSSKMLLCVMAIVKDFGYMKQRVVGVTRHGSRGAGVNIQKDMVQDR